MLYYQTSIPLSVSDGKVLVKTQARRPALMHNLNKDFRDKSRVCMRYKFYVSLLACLWSTLVFSQLDSVQKLNEVLVVDRQIKSFSTGQLVFDFSDKQLQDSPGTLTDFLQQESTLFLKQNGYGMVSSPSFRGTTAQQTAVVWNGFNINSQFNGQTDFNTLLVDGFDEISVRSGGGSIVYGTGAIGGSIHLNNQMHFDGETEVEINSRYGSFNTLQNLVKASTSNDRWSLGVAISRLSSDNDYNWPNTNRQNVNGEFEHHNLNLNLSTKLNRKNTLTYNGMYYNGDRHFSLLFPTDNKSKYLNEDHRHALTWESDFQDFKSVLKMAYFDENYQYIANIDNPNPAESHAKTALSRYSLHYNFKDFDFNFLSEYNYSTADGDDLEEDYRTVAAFALLAKHHLRKLTSEVSFRQEFSNVYDSPFLFSTGLNYDWTEVFSSKLNVSKNFRMPTFNDLFWENAGRTDLKPEISNQAEISGIFQTKSKKLKISVTGFYNDITDMILWIPAENAVWKPENVDEVETYGLESHFHFQQDFNQHKFRLNSNYAYTISENKRSGNQLTYIPKHKLTSGFVYEIQNFKMQLQSIYNGELFTRSSNLPNDILEDYTLWNFTLTYQVPVFQNLAISAQVRNLTNEAYQTMENRPMPGRHFFMNMNINF